MHVFDGRRATNPRVDMTPPQSFIPGGRLHYEEHGFGIVVATISGALRAQHRSPGRHGAPTIG